MAKIKSLGLEGAKRAVRKLFGRQASPAVNTGSPAGDSDLDSGTSTATDTGTSTGVGNEGGDGAGGGGPRRGEEGDCHLSPGDIHPKHGSATLTASTESSSLPAQANVRQSGQDGQGDDPYPSNKNHIKTTTDRGEAASATDTMNSIRSPSARPNYQECGKMDQKFAGKENVALIAPGPDSDKENQPPDDVYENALSSPMKKLGLVDTDSNYRSQRKRTDEQAHVLAAEEDLTEEEKAFRAEREKHLVFIEEALDMARHALKINETPVGCVLVHNGKVIARGMNATNVTRNGTRHAEFMALGALLSRPSKDGPPTTSLKPRVERKPEEEANDNASTVSSPPDEGNEDGSKGHLYPYSQKEHPDEYVDKSIIRECILYVTVEPCVMCASLLRQLGIKKVFFGAVNDKFGGTGGVFSIHANSLPVRDDGQTASAHPQPLPMRLPDGKQVLGTSFPPSGGDGGNVEPGYEIEGGWGRDEAVGLLRRFYVQENGRAPVPRKKEGRAARLAAMMDNDNGSMNSGSAGGGTLPDGDDLSPPADGMEKNNDIDGQDGSGQGVGQDQNDEAKRQAHDVDSTGAVRSG